MFGFIIYIAPVYLLFLPDFLYSDYWVIRTDYIDYAVVYGCRELDSTGHCTHVQSWIWSRYPAVPESDQTLVDNTMEELCVNTSMYLPTEQNNGISLFTFD